MDLNHQLFLSIIIKVVTVYNILLYIYILQSVKRLFIKFLMNTPTCWKKVSVQPRVQTRNKWWSAVSLNAAVIPLAHVPSVYLGGRGRVMYIIIILQYRCFFIARRYWRRQRCWKTRVTTGGVLPAVSLIDDEDIGHIIMAINHRARIIQHTYIVHVYNIIMYIIWITAN